jgi:hypothetical protein
MTAPNANVTIQFLAKNAAEAGVAAVEQDLAGVTAAASEADAALAAFTEQLAQPTTTEGFLQRVQDDVRTATADFKAGIISVEDYQVALQTARTEAIAQRKGVQLGGKELSLFSGIMDQTAQHTQSAFKGTRTLTNAIVSLAAGATGASGSLGSVARVALLMGSGGLIAGAITAGVAGVTALYNHWAAAAQATKKAHDELFASIAQAAAGVIPESAKREQQRLELERQATVLHDKQTKALIRLAQAREVAGVSAAHQELAENAALEVEKNVEEQNRIQHALNQLLLVDSDEKTKAFTKHRDELLLEAALVGQDADMQFRLRLEAEKMSPVRIAALVAIRQETLAHLDLVAAQQAELQFAQQRRRFLAAATMQEPTLRGRGRAPIGRPPAPAGRDIVDTEALTAAEDLAHRLTDTFGLSIDMVEELGRSLDDLATGSLAALGDGFEAVFNAIIEGGKVSAGALLGGLLGAISKAAIHEAAYYTARGFAALAASWFPFPDPKNAVSAAQYFKAAALMGAVGLGAGIAAGAVGGGPGSAGGASEEGATRNAGAAQREQVPLTVVIRGPINAVAPEFVDLIAQAFGEATNRNIILIREPEST